MDKCAKRRRPRVIVTVLDFIITFSFVFVFFGLPRVCLPLIQEFCPSWLADLIVKAGSVHGYPWLVGLQDVLHSHGGHVDHNKADMPEKTRVLAVPFLINVFSGQK
jgi:hypothetical protein